MALRWLACEARTGRIIADLPNLAQTSPLKLTIGRSETAMASLPIPGAPDDWQRATMPGYSTLIALDNDVPVWGGLVTQRRRLANAGARVAALSLTTMEGYFDRRYVGTVTYAAQQQTAIVAALALAYAGGADGIPLQFSTTASATLRDRTYSDLDDMTLYSALTNLMGVLGGPEWTVSWTRLSSPERYVPVLQSADRIGAPAPALFGPAAEFYLPGSILSAETVEDYGSGQGANDVMANSSSQNDVRPSSPHQIGPDDGRPKFEYRWMPSSSIINIDVLTAHAQRALSILAPGSTALTIVAQKVSGTGFVAPRLGTDWFIGDDIRYQLDDPAWPDGLAGIGRAIGWQLNDDTVAPILALPNLNPVEDA